MKYTFEVLLYAYIAFTDAELFLLKEASEKNSDSVINDFSKPGGLLYGAYVRKNRNAGRIILSSQEV